MASILRPDADGVVNRGGGPAMRPGATGGLGSGLAPAAGVSQPAVVGRGGGGGGYVYLPGEANQYADDPTGADLASVQAEEIARVGPVYQAALDFRSHDVVPSRESAVLAQVLRPVKFALRADTLRPPPPDEDRRLPQFFSFKRNRERLLDALKVEDAPVRDKEKHSDPDGPTRRGLELLGFVAEKTSSIVVLYIDIQVEGGRSTDTDVDAILAKRMWFSSAAADDFRVAVAAAILGAERGTPPRGAYVGNEFMWMLYYFVRCERTIAQMEAWPGQMKKVFVTSEHAGLEDALRGDLERIKKEEEAKVRREFDKVYPPKKKGGK